MEWTSEPPTEPGWYWCRRTDNGIKGILELGLFPVRRDGSGDKPVTEEKNRQWAGPIPEPVEMEM